MAHTPWCPDSFIPTICVPSRANQVEVDPDGSQLQFENIQMPLTSFEACEAVIVSTPFPTMFRAMENSDATSKEIGRVVVGPGFSRIFFQKAFQVLLATLYVDVTTTYDTNVFVTAWRESDFTMVRK